MITVLGILFFGLIIHTLYNVRGESKENVMYAQAFSVMLFYTYVLICLILFSSIE